MFETCGQRKNKAMEKLTIETSALESRHRKEKKELQAQVQALKKTAKNDKTKRKELTTQIARLESELEERHKKELEDYEHQSVPPVSVDSSVEYQTELKQKVSKAQKRRDKKIQQEKDRAELIKLQEKENVHGPRNTEIQSINAKLKEKLLSVYQIPSDGDCLYKAVAHQLTVRRNKSMTVEELRRSTADYMRKQKDEFFPFMSNPETSEMLSNEEFESYCDNILNTKVWGGQLEIRALSNSLKCPITVIQATGPECIEQGTEFDGSPLIITYHRHMYKLGEHYNSTQYKEDSGSNDDDRATCD